MGVFLNATFGNLVELILACIALKQGEVRVVQASVMGNIISCSFLAGGLKYHIQEFNEEAAQTNASLMTLACSSLIVPTVSSVDYGIGIHIVYLNHYMEIVLLIVYGYSR